MAPAKTKNQRTKRAIGVVRVSRIGEREGEAFHSPAEQRQRIEAACERDGLKLVDVVEELDVSGRTPLEKRHGIRQAVEQIEAGKADVIVAAYFDRLFRSYKVQAEVVERVEAAGGAVLTVDVGQVTNGSAGQWLSGYLLGGVSEYLSRTTAERTAGARRRAVERGVPTFPLPPGLRRVVNEDGTLGGVEHDPATSRHIVEAFEMRAAGAPIREVRLYLRENGIDRSFHGTQQLLGNRAYRGEIHHGQNTNLAAFEPLVPPALFDKVQRTRVSRGRRAVSDRLLARQNILVYGTCGGRMSVGATVQGQQRYPFYRCSPLGDCEQRMVISAVMVEDVVVETVQRLLKGIRGKASGKSRVVAAEKKLEKAEAALSGAVETLTGYEDVPGAREKLAELRDAWEQARDRRDELVEAEAATLTFDPADDWEALTLEERRAFVRATIDRVVIGPGRGEKRIVVVPRTT
jgi:DNA invertase Pin-like site-specific DNA recombinase